MRFKEISVHNRSESGYSKSQGDSIRKISKKINEIGQFFDKIVELENLLLKNVYNEYLGLINIRENREEIEKIGGRESYINDYFIKATDKVNNMVDISISEWNDANEKFPISAIQEKIDKLKIIKMSLCNSDNSQFNCVCDVINLFGNFKIYKVICQSSKLERIELLLSFKDMLINMVENGNASEEIKKSAVSIDDL